MTAGWHFQCNCCDSALRTKKSLGTHMMKKHLKTHMAYFKKLSKKSGKNITYYAQFQTCQLLNIMMLVLNFWATHQFLPSSSSSGFSSYGSDVVNYLTTDADEWDSTNPGPMCLTFPTVVRINILLRIFLTYIVRLLCYHKIWFSNLNWCKKLVPGQKYFLVLLSLCPETRAGAKIPGQTPLSRDVPGQNEFLFIQLH